MKQATPKENFRNGEVFVQGLSIDVDTNPKPWGELEKES